MNKLNKLFYVAVGSMASFSVFANAGINAAKSDGTSVTNFMAAWTGNIVQVATIVAYVAGALMLLGGFFKIKAHAEDPRQTPFSQVAGTIGTGLGLLVFGYIISSVGDSATSKAGGANSQINLPGTMTAKPATASTGS